MKIHLPVKTPRYRKWNKTSSPYVYMYTNIIYNKQANVYDFMIFFYFLFKPITAGRGLISFDVLPVAFPKSMKRLVMETAVFPLNRPLSARQWWPSFPRTLLEIRSMWVHITWSTLLPTSRRSYLNAWYLSKLHVSIFVFRMQMFIVRNSFLFYCFHERFQFIL